MQFISNTKQLLRAVSAATCLLSLSSVSYAAICGVTPVSPVVTPTWSHTTKSTIQAAVDDSNCSEIWLINGTYETPGLSYNINTPYRPPLVNLHRNVAIYGGFTGSEASRSARPQPIDRTQTVLSGRYAQRPILFSGAITSTTSINDLSITMGNTATLAGLDSRGGGVLCGREITTDCSPVFNNVRFYQNRGSSGLGGAVGIFRYDVNARIAPVFNQVAFERNDASFGNAVYLYDYGGHNTMRVVFNDATFDNNLSGYFTLGGSALSIDSGARTLNGVRYTGNMAVELNRVRFTNNDASNSGGAISTSVVSWDYLQGGEILSSNYPQLALTVNDAEFTGNQALGTAQYSPGYAMGGAVFHRVFAGIQRTTYNNVSFDNNAASAPAGKYSYGGAVGEYVEEATSILETTYNNVTLTNNRSNHYSGAIYTGIAERLGLPASSNRQRSKLHHVTMAGNTVQGVASGYGMNSANLEVRNSIMLDPLSAGANSLLVHDTIAPLSCETYPIASGVPDCSQVLAVDPMLMPLADNGGFGQTMRPNWSSPALDSANTATCLSTDQRGVARPQGLGCDMGAVERRPDHTLAVSITGYASNANTVSAASTMAAIHGGISTCTQAGGSACTAVFDGEASEVPHVVLTASLASGYHFTGWGGACSAAGSDLIASVTVDQSRECSAGFDINSYTVSLATPVPTGLNLPSALPASIHHNANHSVTFSAQVGYHIESVTGCSGSLDSSTGVYTTGAITGDCAITVTTALNSYGISGSVAGLLGEGLQLELTSASAVTETVLPDSGDTRFAFTSTVAFGGDYAVSITAQPTGPAQNCHITNGSGTMAAGAVENIAVTCTTLARTISLAAAEIDGLLGTSPLLPVTVDDGSAFSFQLQVQPGFTVHSVSGCGGSYTANTSTYTIAVLDSDCMIELQLLPPAVAVPTLGYGALGLLGLLTFGAGAFSMRRRI